MERFQIEQGIVQEAVLLPSQEKVEEKLSLVEQEVIQKVAQVLTQKRQLQAWHVLVPIFAVFWIAFAIVLIASNFFFLVVSSLAIVGLSSILVIALAWAFQNDI